MTLGKRSDYGDSRYVGVEVDFSSDVKNCLQVSARSSCVRTVPLLASPGFWLIRSCVYYDSYKRWCLCFTAINRRFSFVKRVVRAL
jgi:hypothetical protein